MSLKRCYGKHYIFNFWKKMNKKPSADEKESDYLREPPLRYLGYANEVGEAFRSQVHVNWVRGSYGIATCYVIADAIHKGTEASKKPWPTEEKRQFKTRWAVIDTLIWQGLASVIIPGFTINRICALTGNVLMKSSKLPIHVRKWITTGIGLGCIPFIIKPIDKSVDVLMESSIRQYYHKGHIMETIVHHKRND